MTVNRLLLPGMLLAAGLASAAAAIVVSASAADAPPPASAQRPWNWPTRAKNLKVLPKNTPPDNLRAIMTGFTRSLGVRCSHCHVGEEGAPLSTYDFVSDKNPKKNVARGMYEMVGTIDKRLEKIQPGKKERATLWCHTCHHGRPVPMTLAEELTRTYTRDGVDSTLAHYRSLRSRFLEAGAYDFREGSLNDVAEVALARKDSRGAVALLEINAKQFPESGRVHEALGQAYLAAGDTVRAVASYETVVRLEPRNARAAELLKTIRRAP